MSASRLLLLRHAEPVGANGRCIGQHDVELSPTGIDAVHSLGARLAGHHACPRLIVSSDLRRARETASSIAQACGMRAVFDARFREVGFGEWDGRTWDDIMNTDGHRLRAWCDDWVNVAPPDGESGNVFARRVKESLATLRAMIDDANAGDVFVVSHAGWIRVATALLLSEHLSGIFARRIDWLHAACFRMRGDRLSLVTWNAAGPLWNVSEADAP